MAEPASKLVLEIIKDDCNYANCPYRYGDESHNKKLVDRIDKKLKHRVADGNEVRALERRVKDLETVLSKIVEVSDKGKRPPIDLLNNAKKLLPTKR